jgi:hypothetical protein
MFKSKKEVKKSIVVTLDKNQLKNILGGDGGTTIIPDPNTDPTPERRLTGLKETGSMYYIITHNKILKL